jgi:hypothetical protein
MMQDDGSQKVVLIFAGTNNIVNEVIELVRVPGEWALIFGNPKEKLL